MLCAFNLGRSNLHGLTRTGSEVTKNRPSVYLEQSGAPESLRLACRGNAKIDWDGMRFAPEWASWGALRHRWRMWKWGISYGQGNDLILTTDETKEITTDFREKISQPCARLQKVWVLAVAASPRPTGDWQTASACQASSSELWQRGRTLWRTIQRTVERLTGKGLYSMDTLYTEGCWKGAESIIGDTLRAAHCLLRRKHSTYKLRHSRADGTVTHKAVVFLCRGETAG